MRWDNIRNVLAAVGAFVLVMLALALVITVLSGKDGFALHDKVAVIEIQGVIVDPADITQELRELADRDDVKAVVVRIDSPGGAVGPSQEMYSGISRLKEKKPVVASMGSIAASGGFYAAVAANKIVANPGTITGSIGVIIEFMNAEELLNKIGLKGYVVKSGRYKDVGSPLRKMEKDETELLQSVIDDVNRQFIRAVATGRNMKEEDVARIADGRIFSGAQALDRGLVDRLGDLTDAINLSAELAGIKGKPHVIYPEKKASGLWKVLFGESLNKNITELFSGLRIMYLTPKPDR